MYLPECEMGSPKWHRAIWAMRVYPVSYTHLMNRCAVCGSSQISLMADGKYYHCEACGATSNHPMPAADLAKVCLLYTSRCV